jgi:hypothetical protein
MTKFYNELEQSWRKLKQDHPEVAKAIEESDEREYLGHGGWKSASQTTPCDDLIYRAPMQTEAEKFLAKWGGKKIWQEGMGRHAYHLVTRVMAYNRVYVKDHDGKCGHIVLRVSDNWQLWESPIKLDPLGPEDIEQGDVVRCKENDIGWSYIEPGKHHVYILSGNNHISYDDLMLSHEIRSIGGDWRPCHKQ